MFQLIAFAGLTKFLSKHFHIKSKASTWNFSARAVQANRVASCPRNYLIVFEWGGNCSFIICPSNKALLAHEKYNNA
jgi:hypothetical protein